MEAVLAIAWSIIFLASLHLSESAPIGSVITERTVEEKKTTSLAKINNGAAAKIPSTLPFTTDVNVTYTGTSIFTDYRITFTVHVAAHDKSNVTAVEEIVAITLGITFPHSALSGNASSPAPNEPGGNNVDGNSDLSRVTPGVSSTASEATRESVTPDVIGTTSAKIPSATRTEILSPGSGTTPNGDLESDTDISLLDGFPSAQGSVTPTETFGNLVALSTGNTGVTTQPTNTPGREKTTASATTTYSRNTKPTLEKFPEDEQGESTCYPNCDVIPAWATVLLCLATTFFIFALVGLVFLFPYCTKFRHLTARPYGSSPRYSA